MPGPAALNTGDVTLLLSHSQQLLNSQNQAYANLLCWRPSNLFPPRFHSTGERRRVRKKYFFSFTHSRFVLVRPHSTHRPCVFLPYTQPLSGSLKLPPLLHSFLPRSLSLWSILQSLPHSLSLSLNLCVSLKFKFKFKQLHWHDKRESWPDSFCVPAPPQSGVPWPSNLWSGSEHGLYDVEEGQMRGQTHYGHVSVEFV